MALNTDSDATSSKIAVLSFTKSTAASVAISCGETDTKKHLLTDTTGKPCLFISDLSLIVM